MMSKLYKCCRGAGHSIFVAAEQCFLLSMQVSGSSWVVMTV